jgi:hypothetical protein
MEVFAQHTYHAKKNLHNPVSKTQKSNKVMSMKVKHKELAK